MHPTVSLLRSTYKAPPTTHETFIHAVRDAAIKLGNLTDNERSTLQGAKLVYGRGESGLRGITCYAAWQNGHPEPVALIEVCAAAEENWIQLAGTTVHELGHAITRGTGHGPEWKAACERLGLRSIKAAGTLYQLANFDPRFRAHLAHLPKPTDGTPLLDGGHFGRGQGVRLPNLAARPCSAGIGTRGGKSRGPGSGSRLRKFTCQCEPPVIVRASRDTLEAHCDHCGSAFNRA